MASAFAQGADVESAPLIEDLVPAAAPPPRRPTGWAGHAAVASAVLLLLSGLALVVSRGGLPRSAEEAVVVTAGARGVVSLAEEGGDFDCDAGYSNWEKGWSAKKVQFCCAEEQKACFSVDSGFVPAIVVQDFTKDEKHDHCLAVAAGDIVFTRDAHPSGDWAYVYTRWFLGSPHGFVPRWALNENTTKVVRAFTHKKDDSKDHKGWISVALNESVFVQDKRDSGWSWVAKIKTEGEAPEKVEGWVPDWALPGKSTEANSTEADK